ncbi:MAG: indolepyruvate oxidoreductase subunit beta [Candidatus Pacebacteria bacterium]|nr:indolepyruvate oxidoreductase subunit beta [Candidatus Paceibacterota bacterium]
MDKTFNIVISGVGGQGLVTLLKIISQAAFDEGFDVKTSELHGLSQRGGSVEVYIRFGEQVFSPMVPKGQANLIIALEQQEVLNGAQFASKKSIFLINKYQTPTLAVDVGLDEIKQRLADVSKKVFVIPASEICQKKLGNEVVSGIYLLGYAVRKKYLPLPMKSLEEAIKKTMPEKFWELNLKALHLSKT